MLKIKEMIARLRIPKNTPYCQVREFLKHLVNVQIDFIIIVSDVLRYSIKKGKFKLGVDLYFGKDAQKFYRPEGGIRAIHCGWIATIPDNYGENKKYERDKVKE